MPYPELFFSYPYESAIKNNQKRRKQKQKQTATPPLIHFRSYFHCHSPSLFRFHFCFTFPMFHYVHQFFSSGSRFHMSPILLFPLTLACRRRDHHIIERISRNGCGEGILRIIVVPLAALRSPTTPSSYFSASSTVEATGDEDRWPKPPSPPPLPPPPPPAWWLWCS